MKPKAAASSIKQVTDIIEGCGLSVHLSQGEEVTIIGAVGDKAKLDTCAIQLNPEVERIHSFAATNVRF